jgi:hypothetical protein
LQIDIKIVMRRWKNILLLNLLSCMFKMALI